jgi:hypothetical protein
MARTIVLEIAEHVDFGQLKTQASLGVDELLYQLRSNQIKTVKFESDEED